MKYSCLKTLASKHNSTSRKIVNKFRDGKGGWSIPYETAKGSKHREFAKFMDCKNTDLYTDTIIDWAIKHNGSITTFEQRLSAYIT